MIRPQTQSYTGYRKHFPDGMLARAYGRSIHPPFLQITLLLHHVHFSLSLLHRFIYSFIHSFIQIYTHTLLRPFHNTSQTHPKNLPPPPPPPHNQPNTFLIQTPLVPPSSLLFPLSLTNTLTPPRTETEPPLSSSQQHPNTKQFEDQFPPSVPVQSILRREVVRMEER